MARLFRKRFYKRFPREFRFGHSRKRFPRLKKCLKALGGLLVIALLWTLYAFWPLRPFLPHTFELLTSPDGERNYLIVFQNNEELRPTGGFITAFAVLKFQNGIPTGLSIQDVYGEIDDHPYQSPPYPLDLLLEEGSETYIGHTFRDANTHPDFTESAEDMLDFFEITYPDTPIDGVFAVNFSVLEAMLALVEPIQIHHYEFDSDNLFELLEGAVSDIDLHNIEALSQRKAILQTFAKTLLKRIAFRPWTWDNLGDVIRNQLEEKEILLAFNEENFPELSEKMNQFVWDGSLPAYNDAEPTDQLIVNLSNYGGMKSNRYVTQDVRYMIEPTLERQDDGGLIVYATLDITIAHNGDYNTPLSGWYKGYIRAFFPEGTTLVESSTGDSVAETLDGYVGWGDPVYLDPGASVTYTYTVQLNPQFFEENPYRLNLIKQPGTENRYHQIVLRNPVGYNLESDDFEVVEHVGVYQTQLNHDTTIAATRLSDTSGPRVVAHFMTDLNQIEIWFSETLSQESSTDPLHYEITDLNMNIPGATDTLTIESITTDGNIVRIQTAGMTEQTEEHYQILMRNIRDLRGNLITPTPRTITVVQRY